MTHELSRPDLQAAFRRVAPAIGTDQPIYAGVRLAVSGGKVTIDAHNGELYFQAAFQSAATPDLQPVVVPGRPLGRFLRTLEQSEDETVGVEVLATNEARLTASQTSMVIRTFDADDWTIAVFPTDGAVVLSPADLDRVRSVLFAASTDVARGVLLGLHLAENTATAVDNVRLAQTTLDAGLGDFVVPASFFKEALRSCTGPAHLLQDERRVVLSDAGGFWSSVLMNLQFPDVKQLLDRDTEATLNATTESLRRALEHVSVLDSPRVHLLVEQVGSASLVVSAEGVGVVEAHFGTEGDWLGHTWFDRRHLAEAIDHHDAERVELRFTGVDKPVLIRGERLVQMLTTRSSD